MKLADIGLDQLCGTLATDGVTVAWSQAQWLVTPGTPSYRIKSMPLAGGAVTTLDTAAATPTVLLRGGVVAWHVLSSDKITSKLWSQSQGAVVLSPAGSTVSSVNSGYALYSDGTSTRTWQGTTGASTVRIEGAVSNTQISNNWIYFTTGDGIYRIPLS